MINTFAVYFISNFIIFILYILRWTELYPQLTFENIAYHLFFTILIIPSYIFIKKVKKIKIQEINIDKLLQIILIYNIIQFIYVGHIPLIEILTKKNYIYRNFKGIPSLHVFFTTLNIYISILVGYNYCLKKNKENLIKYLLSLIPFMLIYSRALFLISLLAVFNIWIYLNKNKIRKNIFKVSMAIILMLYTFGIIGNIRHGYKYNDNTMILNIGKASQNFKDSNIPKEIFWTYLYTTSSLANFQLNLNEVNYNYDMKKYVIQTILPEFIKKRITEEKRLKFKQIFFTLNGAPDMTFPYIYLGKSGVILFLILKSLLVNMYVYICSKKNNSKFLIPNLSVMAIFIFYNSLNNFFIYGGLIMIIIYPIIFLKLNKTKRKERYR